MTYNEQLNAIALMEYLDESSLSDMQENGLQVNRDKVSYKGKSYKITSNLYDSQKPLATVEVEDGLKTYSIITKRIYAI